MARTFYVAASSLDIERAELQIRKLRAAGLHVTSTWPENIRKVGSANPYEASAEQRAQWSRDDLAEIAAADTFWLLVPHVSKPTRGAWLELGAANAAGKLVICSGDTAQSIFCALGHEFESDDDAFEAICTHLIAKGRLP